MRLGRMVQPAEYVLLGHFHGRTVFAAEFIDESTLTLPAETGFEDLRLTGAALPQDEAGLLPMRVQWCCGAAGTVTAAPAARLRRARTRALMKGSNPTCGAEHFPRLDPAVIVLVSDGSARCSMEASWPAGR